MLHPNFPVVEGRYQMTVDWAVTLPGKFNQRVEDGTLCFWRPGVTVWVDAWNNDKSESQQQRLNKLQRDISPEAFDDEVLADGNVTRFAYRLTEPRDKGVVHALYAFAIGADGHVQMAVYLDDENDLELAREIWVSLQETRSI